jgi:ATP-binding cassette subfamily B protein
MFMAGLLRQISIGVDRIDKILYTDEMKESDEGLRPADSSVVFENVCFSYDKTEILKNISFKAEPKTVTALVGASGAGKTTIGYLTVRFWDIYSGFIKLGGVDIKKMPVSELMEHISFVFQDCFMFFDTIKENIRMGNLKASEEDIIEAAKAARCHEFIMRLPQGYNTLVGEGGTYLSGGEQQRVSIARAILKDSPVVILDEATAFADPENEGKILQALSRLTKDKTVIIIAHRLSTITTADKIIVIDEGEIKETGTHDKLLQINGIYSLMWKTYSRAREWTLVKQEV